MAISLLVTAVILTMGAFAIWMLVAALRPGPSVPPAATPPPTIEPVTPPESDFNGALNLYMTAPDRLPAGADRVELSLVKAALARADGAEIAFFEGSRRVVLQQGVTEKVLSERIPNGHWARLKLTFSPAADLAYADGRPSSSALVQRREAVLSFDADVPASRTLALFARAPLEASAGAADGVVTLSLATAPQPAERYVFGAFLLDARDRGDVWSIASPSLAAAVKEDLGFDITRQQAGSAGFVPAQSAPSTPTPQ